MTSGSTLDGLHTRLHVDDQRMCEAVVQIRPWGLKTVCLHRYATDAARTALTPVKEPGSTPTLMAHVPINEGRQGLSWERSLCRKRPMSLCMTYLGR